MSTVRPVSVQGRAATHHYPWATSVTISKRGELKIFQGWQQRAFHPHGEWLSFTVQADSPGEVKREDDQEQERPVEHGDPAPLAAGPLHRRHLVPGLPGAEA
jgi:hypothetical protein